MISSPVLIIISLYLALHVALPLGTWLLFVDRDDNKVRLWFIGLILFCLYNIFVSLRPLLPTLLGHEIAWMSGLTGWLVITEVFRRERGLEPGRWTHKIAVIVGMAVYLAVANLSGYSTSYGITGFATVLVVLWGVNIRSVIQLRRTTLSKSLILILIALFLYSIPNILRIAEYLRTGDPAAMNVFKWGWAGNVLVVASVVAIVFLTLGYWGYVLEKTIRERNRAQAGQLKAESDTEAMRKIVQERDHLLVMNSRFSVVSALSSFSAMLIHDISQPLQTLQLGLERIRSNIRKGVSSTQIDSDLDHLDRASEQAGDLVQTLRELMRSGESQVRAVPLTSLLSQIDQILRSESLQRKVALTIDSRLQPHQAVMAESVMLQRIIVNLVGNSLTQFQNHPVPCPRVSIILEQESRDDVEGIVISVVDNGSGFPEAVLARVGQPWSSKSQDGLGLALMLSRQLVSLWGGEFELHNAPPAQSGARVRIWLRQA